MNILPISTIANQSNKLTFKGLWGQELKKDYSYINNYYGAEQEIVDMEFNSNYYPFLDESENSIKDKVGKYISQSYNYVNDKAFANGKPDVVRQEYKVNVMPNLPIKMADWASYVKNKMSLSLSQRTFIENTLKRAKLTKYLK